MKKITLILAFLFSLIAVGQECSVYLTPFTGFVAHDTGKSTHISIHRSFEQGEELATNLEVFYTVSGDTNETDLVSGSVILPIGVAKVDIEVLPINAPNTTAADRQITVTLTPNPSYTIAFEYNRSYGIATIDIKDKEPLKAFPSAYGGGAYSKGGRGGNVYHVTNLKGDDSVGSFRWALGQPRPATIVFDVSGIISIPYNLNIDGNNLTVAGQTAPEGGITLTMPPTNLNIGMDDAEDVIIRYLTIRDQFYYSGAFNVHPGYDFDFVGDTATKNVMFDHMSLSWAGTSLFNIRGRETYNMTFQHGMMGEGTRGSLFGDTGYTGFSYNLTMRNSVFYHVSHRTPNSSGQNSDIYNNVVFEWSQRLTIAKDGSNINYFNNYVFNGGRTELENQWETKYVNGITLVREGARVNVFSDGNIIQDLFDSRTDDEINIWMRHAGWDIPSELWQKTRPNTNLFQANPHPYIGVAPSTFLTAEQAKDSVPKNAGNYKYIKNDGTVGTYRDVTDTRYLNEIENDIRTTWSAGGSTLQDGRHTARDTQEYADFVAASTSETSISSRPSNFYNPAKSEHIPEVWFDANVPDGQNHNDIAPSGYTWLEEYMNQVDDAIPTVTNPVEPIVYPETLSFPNALGGGANSRSTDDYSIYEVTNLNSVGPGSLWEGMRQSNTIIVFRVGGIISMNEPEQTSYSNGSSNIIVLGQTAPYPGITVVGNGFKYVSGENIIMRYMRFRQWRCRTELHAPCSADVIDHIDSNNIIYDHCSFAYGGDESLSTRGASTNFTLSNSIVSYGLSGGLFGDSSDYTLGDNYSSIGNLWHTVGKRTPNPNGNGRFDILGNVTYNVLNLAMRTGGDVQLNEIGNYYKYTLRSHMATSETPSIFTQNNRSNQYSLTANNQDNEIIWQDRDFNTGALISQYFTETMHPLLNYDIPLIDGDAAYLRVSNREMGANKYLDNNGNAVTYIDDLDTAAFTEFDNDTRFDWKDSTGLVSTDPENRTQSNYRVIPQRSWLTTNEPNFGVIVNEHSQATHIGVVPNAWITAQGLIPATFNPLGNDLNATYTNIEMYSFGVDGIVAVVNRPTITLTGSSTINLIVGATYTDAGATATDVEDGNVTTDIVVSSNVNTAIAGTYEVKYNVEDTDGNNAIEVIRTVIVASDSTPSVTGGTTRKAKFIIINN